MLPRLTNYTRILNGKNQILNIIADCRAKLRCIPANYIDACITSPPYYGLRDYGNTEQIGLEPTIDEYITNLVEVFREVRRVLKDDGTLWVIMGDSYAGGPRGWGGKNTVKGGVVMPSGTIPNGMKPKDLMGVPWMLAFALRDDGWYLRSDNIWEKPNGMCESAVDRCNKVHEYIFMLAKSPKYYFDGKAIAEPSD